MKPLEVTYYPGKPAKGRAKAKPPHWVIYERGTHVSLLEVKPGLADCDPSLLYVALEAMTSDFNGLWLRGDRLEKFAEKAREALARLDR